MTFPRSLLLCALILPASIALAGDRAASPALLNGRNLDGWDLVTTPAAALDAVCHLRPNGVLALDGKPSGFLQTTREFVNFRLHVEWRWPGAPGNSGVLLHISSGPKDRVWPVCFQVQMKNRSAGDLLPMAGALFAEPLAPDLKTPTRPHLAPDSEQPGGQWNVCDITCLSGSIEVLINGVVQNRVTGCTPAGGHIGFQLEGTPFELRNLSLTPL